MSVLMRMPSGRAARVPPGEPQVLPDLGFNLDADSSVCSSVCLSDMTPDDEALADIDGMPPLVSSSDSEIEPEQTADARYMSETDDETTETEDFLNLLFGNATSLPRKSE